MRDYTDTHAPAGAPIDTEFAAAALDLFGVDTNGLNAGDRELLTALCRDFNGGPVGLETLAASVGETPSTLAEVNEPYLMRQGYLARTSRGRVATAAAYAHLGLDVPRDLLHGGAGAPAASGPASVRPAPGHSAVADYTDATLPGV